MSRRWWGRIEEEEEGKGKKKREEGEKEGIIHSHHSIIKYNIFKTCNKLGSVCTVRRYTKLSKYLRPAGNCTHLFQFRPHPLTLILAT